MQFTITKEVIKLDLIEEPRVSKEPQAVSKKATSPESSRKPLEIIVKPKISKGIEKKITGLKKIIPPRDDYAKHTEDYRIFHAEYMKSIVTQDYKAYIAEPATKTTPWIEEAISYKERKELVRTIQMNSMMGGAHNHVDPSLKDAYENWKMCSKSNEQMSFMMYDLVISPC